MFLNSITTNTKLKILDNNRPKRQTKMKGDYALYNKTYYKSHCVYPMLSIRDANSSQSIIETFIVEEDLTLLQFLKEEKIIKIELIKENSYQTT